jgi:Fe-S-cluster-containing dehydrogenase component
MSDNARRDFLKQVGITTAATVGLSSITAKADEYKSGEVQGVLVDIGVCVGCRNCERACQVAHNLPAEDPEEYHNRDIYKEFRRPNTHSLTVVNEFENPKNKLIPYDVKYQCMHCNHPACVSACIVGALTKNKNGAVTWDTNKCIGCRYCMVACPFQIPTFEYDKAIQPKIMKCDFCFERTKEGLLPACVANCPVEALTYGNRDELLVLAKKRIARYPDKYIPKVFGEDEVGGTSWLYIAPVDFETLMFPKLGDKPAPGVTEAIQHGIFSYFIPPLALFGWLGGVMWLSKRKKELTESETKKEEDK